MREHELVEELLNRKVIQYNQPGFIENDPVSIPRAFTKKEDIEISGFISSILAWGQRKTIINKCHELLERMDNTPYDFILNHHESDLKKLESFKHRTFNDTDTLYFIEALKYLYKYHGGLEGAFIKEHSPDYPDTSNAIIGFRKLFFSLEDHPRRTEKHISNPLKNATCKRINMYLRWMVRKDTCGVDFGIWNGIKMSQLICPCDVHVERVATTLSLLKTGAKGWKMATELTEQLKEFDPEDPVKYDFALFGMGVDGYL